MKISRTFSTNFILILSFLITINCDTSKKKDDNLVENLLCYSFANCGNSNGTRFGMLGDSWTDLLFGAPAIQTLRYHLENSYDYKITGATLGGQEISRVLSGGLHIQVIDQAGADIKYMLLSLGGNDLQFNPGAYVLDPIGERAKRFAEFESNLKTIVYSGNLHKQNKYGGEPLIWIIHGYDYPNPLNENQLSSTSCRSSLLAAGFADSQIQQFTSGNLDLFNDFLQNLTFEIPGLVYINLRGNLGGPPYSDAGNMFDCIHPTSLGFKTITDKYVLQLKVTTGDEK
ncbi:SGNH/GDSL hydrolase family protein [Leptospira sp. GIMC2001]|uniref:SGNH/GDSL hydrolase family protein n=1 Tax=Leptospira sp. GIMC2001 TaxID=1513297 RepID=UPI00234B14E3|nr:SGNH/GDSL hydrolase family protein [Leptospira sp. GIMC2001]WCL49934.1 SGNH/GDSL hydrolase family protein [Leptospira sp. GIMC2001]